MPEAWSSPSAAESPAVGPVVEPEPLLACAGYASPGVVGFRVFAESMAVGDLSITRLWHGPCTLASTELPEGAPTGPRLVIAHDGAVVVERDSGALLLRNHTAVLLDGAERFALVAHGPSARVEVVLPPALLTRNGIDPTAASGRVLDAPAHASLLAGQVAAILATGLSESAAGAAALGLSVEFLVVALLREALVDGGPGPGSSGERSLWSAAVALVRARSSDPELSAARLATLLNVSDRHLRRAFAVRGTSPAAEIRTARTQRARLLLRDRRVTSAAEAETVALQAGFRSARAMRDAFDAAVSTGEGRARAGRTAGG